MSVASLSRSTLDALEVDYARFNAQKTVSTGAPSRFECFNVGALSVTRDRNRADSYYNRILGFRAAPGGELRVTTAKLDQALRLFDDPAFEDATVRVDVDVAVDAVGGGSGGDAGGSDVGGSGGSGSNAGGSDAGGSDAGGGNAGGSDAGGSDAGGVCSGASDKSEAVAAALVARGFIKGDVVAWLWADADASTSGPTPDGLRALSPNDHAALRTMLEYEGPVSNEIWELRRHALFAETFKWIGIFDDGTLVSVASLWIAPNIAVLGSGQTLVKARRQGHQNALIRARFGQTSGHLVVDVEPGSTSHRNCLRNGFAPLTVRQTWIRAPAVSTP